eukprot:CAMPEP_0196724254 /NCGR_PEP_ID=MMETSP1091-20130531/6184_1 /TAXON_ID=302021 /ORGANISM="Rhodomonas sp., Strain CCMP768" /LENGTH=270 /DNA_ID=CAMNT_0042066355 /DNA_START=56 /DNA_END=865 /DNA_ORIENTATION=+
MHCAPFVPFQRCTENDIGQWTTNIVSGEQMETGGLATHGTIPERRSVRVYPRRKAGDPSPAGRQKRDALVLTKDVLMRFFGVPLPEAATLLGIGSTALKSSCRKLGIQRWPMPSSSARAFQDADDDFSMPAHQPAPSSASTPHHRTQESPASSPPAHRQRQAAQQTTTTHKAEEEEEEEEEEDIFCLDTDALNVPLLISDVINDLHDLRDMPWRSDLHAILKDVPPQPALSPAAAAVCDASQEKEKKGKEDRGQKRMRKEVEASELWCRT